MSTKVAPELLKDVRAEHQLTHVATEEKNPLPSAEGRRLSSILVKSFNIIRTCIHVYALLSLLSEFYVCKLLLTF